MTRDLIMPLSFLVMTIIALALLGYILLSEPSFLEPTKSKIEVIHVHRYKSCGMYNDDDWHDISAREINL